MNKRINVYQRVPNLSSISQSEYKRNQNGYGEPHCRDEKWLTKMKRLVASFNLIKVDFNYLHILWLYLCISYTCVQHPTIRNDDQWTTRALIIQRTVRLLLQVNVNTNVRGLGGHGHLRLNKSPGDEEVFIHVNALETTCTCIWLL